VDVTAPASADGTDGHDSHAHGAITLQGVGCAAGRATGRCVVVPTLASAHMVRRGDVLVTKYTNPSWTPLFALVCAVVLEEGGMLSHAAVVSRECNLPAVVRVACATRLLRTGDVLSVDGSTGTLAVMPVPRDQAGGNGAQTYEQ
jgi:phosphoenolpyruvate synthase/pyruvate phosphate dikinase